MLSKVSKPKINEMKKLLLLLILILVYTIVCSVGMILIVWLAMKKAMTFSQLTKCGTVGFFSGGIIGADVWGLSYFYSVKINKFFKGL